MPQVAEREGRFVHEFSEEEREKLKGYGNVAGNGVVFFDEVASSEGFWFCLCREPQHTQKDMAEAKQWIKRSRDATAIAIGFLAGI